MLCFCNPENYLYVQSDNPKIYNKINQTMMPFDISKGYTILDENESNVIELQSIRKIENWFQAKIISRKITEALQSQFNEIEASIKQRDFKTVQKIELQILSQQLKIKELDQRLLEIQMGKKDLIYFKIAEEA
jgi:hypothetical protein